MGISLQHVTTVPPRGEKNVARRDVVAQEFTIWGAGKILKCKVREVPVYVNNFNYVYKSIIYIIITIYLQRWCISQRSATLSICNSMSMLIKFTKFSKIFPPSISQDQSELEQKKCNQFSPVRRNQTWHWKIRHFVRWFSHLEIQTPSFSFPACHVWGHRRVTTTTST